MTCLITEATGNVGSLVTERLLDENAEAFTRSHTTRGKRGRPLRRGHARSEPQ